MTNNSVLKAPLAWSQWPSEIIDIGLSAWQLFAKKEAVQAREWTSEQINMCQQAFGLSDFIRETALRYPEVVCELFERHCFEASTFIDMRAELRERLSNVSDEHGLQRQLRLFRHKMMLLIAWKDVLGITELVSVMSEVSLLAEICVDEALQKLYTWQSEKLGIPYSEDGVQQHMLVIGMGKLGGYELNFSSDIDLIFTYPEQGETRGGRKSISNEQFFIKLGQSLVASLNNRTADGFVFRVDMRLRPYGDAGRLAMNFEALHEYYYNIGREWERYAFVKARVISGQEQDIQWLRELLNPFIYRRYIDFSAIESLRKMKGLISKEVRRKGLKNNIKLGAGGIREVEFIGQVFQLIRGGKEPRLQMHSTIGVLRNLQLMQLLPEAVVDELLQAYSFLRKLEHSLQEIADQQTQTLPDDLLNQQRIASMMGFTDWRCFSQQLNAWMDCVHGHFNAVIEEPKSKHATQSHDPCLLLMHQIWDGGICADDEDVIEKLGQAGFAEPDAMRLLLQQLDETLQRKPIGERGRQCLDQLIPLLMTGLKDQPLPDQALIRILPIIYSIACRTSYIELLFENPRALQHLITLCASSPWIAEQLARYPVLLDELLDPRTLFQSPQASQMEDELHQLLLRVPEEDLEQQMEALRHFKLAHVLRVAAADISGNLPIMKVSDQLTFLAETVLKAALAIAWRDVTSKFGFPSGVNLPVQGEVAGFAIVAYGKLGGIELGYSSDLDIVFINEGDAQGMTMEGAKSIPNSVFFARLGQRLIHILSTRTMSGTLYEIDTRLRPSGEAGLLVTHIERFATYQQNEAWTWEHQALVRTRCVAGDVVLAQRFEHIRQQILTKPRDGALLKQEVAAMREKMRTHLGSKTPEQFHLKQDEGGITDIEFLVQYWVLLYAHHQPALVRYSDNIRLLEDLAQYGYIAPEIAALMAEIYRTYRNHGHRLALQKLNSSVDSALFVTQRQEISQIWQQHLSVVN